MKGFTDRENQIFDVLQRFKDQGLEFVVVGGYAVSAYQHRFSVDADLVIQEEDLDEFVTVLESSGFEQVEDRELDVYGGRFLAYERDEALPVTIDLLVDSLQCRQTTSRWRYRYFRDHSTTRRIQGSERSIQVRVPEKELLVAVKLHSGRLTDARDAVALAEDIESEKLGTHIDRGDPDKLRQVLTGVEDTISDPDFEDAFKGVFQQGTLPEDNIQQIQDFIREYT